MAAILFTACTQDELAEQGNTLPDGEYPLQIGSVSITAEASEEPWTRVTENEDGTGSVWQPDDAITVSLDGETATYTYDGSAWTSDAPLYWKNTQTAEVTAWYPATDGALDLGGQDKGLVYVLRATADNASHNTPVNLQFEHQLAKVRVVLNGTQAALAQSVEVYGYTTCTNNEGTPTASGTQDWVKMKHTTYADGTECWEANVVPGNITLDNFVRINGQTAKINDDFPTTLASGNMYTIDLTVGEEITVITEDNCQNINGDGYYRVSGGFGQTITVTGDNPTIYLENANISVDNGIGINITGGSAALKVQGNNSVSSGNNTGIGMGYGNTSQPSIGKITITNSDVTAKAGRYASAIYADGYE